MTLYTNLRYFITEPTGADSIQPGDMKRVNGILSQWNGVSWDVIFINSKPPVAREPKVKASPIALPIRVDKSSRGVK